jgi:hypothetical protein
MSRMKNIMTRIVAAGTLAAGAVATLGKIIAGGPDAPTDRNGRVWTPAAFRRTMRYRGYGRSRYMPHQGEREQTRRIRQMLNGQLRCWTPEAPRSEPIPQAGVGEAISSAALIENGLEAERRAKRREAAQKAARTRAANREKANGTQG